MITTILADIYDYAPWELMKNLFILLALIGSVVVLVLTIWVLCRTLFGRTPPIADDLSRYSASIEKLKLDLAKLPDDEKFNKLADQLKGFATQTMLGSLEIGLEQQMKEVRGYAHDEVHTARNELGSRISALELEARHTGQRLAAIEADSKTHTRTLHSIEGKIDKLTESIGKVKGKLGLL